MAGNRVARALLGVLAGMATGLVELVFVSVAFPLSLIPATRGAANRARDRVIGVERARLSHWLGHADTGPRGGYGFLAVRAVLSAMAVYGCGLCLFLGGLFAFGGLWDLVRGESVPVPITLPGIKVISNSGIVGLTGAAILLVLAGVGLWVVAITERRLADHFLGPSRQEQLRRRIDELTASRSGIVRAVDDERRRIERDLHDGVQQRGVALAMLLGRAQHSADRTKTAELVGQAYLESRTLLDELRSVAWRIYPTALDELGLHAALEGIAERTDTPVTIHYGLVDRPVSEVETALYFLAREAITNAVKHAGASEILIVLDEDATALRITVSDDGRGGAESSGSGLAGLARRILALDGEFTVDSPPGGPTRISARIPKSANMKGVR